MPDPAKTPTKTPAAPQGGIPDDNDDVPSQANTASPPPPSPGREAAAGRERDARGNDAPRCPEGVALFQNTSDKPVRFVLRDEGNRPQRVEAEPGGFCMVPFEYADVAVKRAPQLREVEKRPARHVEE